MPSLAKTADRWRTDEFLIWDEGTLSFVTGFNARMFRVDTFKSIYSRPVHRRQITTAPTVSAPASYVIKQVSTGEIYMISGIRRDDAISNELYNGIMTLHLASSNSGGYAALHRYATVGAGDDLGALIDGTDSSFYIDLELRTSSADRDTHDNFIGHYFVTTPISSGMLEGDYLHLNSVQYRVDEVYVDSGYLMARVAKENYDKENMVYHLPGDSAGYTGSTGVLTEAATLDRIFTGTVVMNEVGMSESSDLSTRSLTVHIDFGHIGFTPEKGHSITYSGTEYNIDNVRIASNKYQWELGLEV